jgi:hypothetical protein
VSFILSKTLGFLLVPTNLLIASPLENRCVKPYPGSALHDGLCTSSQPYNAVHVPGTQSTAFEGLPKGAVVAPAAPSRGCIGTPRRASSKRRRSKSVRSHDLSVAA